MQVEKTILNIPVASNRGPNKKILKQGEQINRKAPYSGAANACESGILH